MPKKFKGENSKATEARVRKAAAQEAVETQKQQQLEDEYWRDEDKHVVKKQQRKDDKEKKKTDQLEKKKEAQRLLEAEQESIKAIAKKDQPAAPKVTRLQAEAHKQATTAATAEAAKDESLEVEPPLVENVNRLNVEGEEARSVAEAIAVLSTREAEVDMHPEKRMKAAYLAYEEKQLPIVKQENPGLRLSQLKQIIFKSWAKAPENPMNQQQL